MESKSNLNLWMNWLIGQRYRIVFAGLIIAGLVLLPSLIRVTPPGREATNCPGIVPQPLNWVVRVVCARDGTPQYVEHKWPFGSPQNIGTLRVPWGYRNLIFGPSIGAQMIFENTHQPSLEQGYGGMFFWAVLPNVSPHDQRVPPITGKPNEFDRLTVQVTPPEEHLLQHGINRCRIKREVYGCYVI